eukprot:15459121-Alexandrium_andersonii.AAC.1
MPDCRFARSAEVPDCWEDLPGCRTAGLPDLPDCQVCRIAGLLDRLIAGFAGLPVAGFADLPDCRMA